jgi:hypothetical protein
MPDWPESKEVWMRFTLDSACVYEIPALFLEHLLYS